jgi:hypothetical protein
MDALSGGSIIVTEATGFDPTDITKSTTKAKNTTDTTDRNYITAHICPPD